jgi:sortase A
MKVSEVPKYRHSTRLSRAAKLRLVVGLVLLAAAFVGVAYPLWWSHRSSVGAKKLLTQDKKQLKISFDKQHTGKACTAAPGPGVLQIPKIQLTAPVLQGLTDSVLNVSIGHDPSTNWPGPNSAALFAAHDVSFFSQLSNLKTGDIITYTVPCATYSFTVTGSQVTSPGASISVPSGGAIVLDTCWPPNALWYTPDRYIVTATYQSTGPQNPSLSTTNAISQLPSENLNFSLPTGLDPSLVQLANNSQEMGQLHFAGSPSTAFEQSNAPLQVEGTALQGWFALLHSLSANQSSWWNAVLPSQAFPSSLVSPSQRSTSPLEITETVQGTSATQVTLVGGVNGHTYSVTEQIHGNTLTVSNFTAS